jgi:hypothetical protein
MMVLNKNLLETADGVFMKRVFGKESACCLVV